ncbi:MAG: class D sortase [Chloroflexi bacterium]|nr:class D sortase [Chloroflexota bacterium]MBI3764527.1 class D sortase [Chloroflexota bacterium]
MKDRRSVDDLSIEELERVLAIKKREARLKKIQRYRASGRAAGGSPELADPRGLRGEEAGEESLSRPRRKLWDNLLLAVEIAAVAGLAFVLISGLDVLKNLNQEVAQAITQPTLTPTPLIEAVVLPSGHTPPTSPGGAQPNDAEIPEHLRALVQSFPPVVIPTPGPQQATRVVIAAIGVDAPVVQGDTWEQLKKGIAQHIGTADPGKNGNAVFSAHNDIFGEIFRDLERLKIGDEIVVYTASQQYTYVVADKRIVQPTEVGVMASTRNATVTLISCYPYLVDNMRVVIIGQLKSG